MENKLTKVKTRTVHIVLEYEDKHNHKIINQKDLQNVLSKIGHYWVILHDADYNENLEKKRNHYHIILIIKSPRQLKWYIDTLTDFFNISPNLITISPATDLLENIRYLVHADDNDKVQYDWNSVLTNDYGTLVEAENYIINVTTSMILQFVNKCETKQELCYILGLTNFKKYLNVINALWSEREYVQKYQDKLNDKTTEEVPF